MRHVNSNLIHIYWLIDDGACLSWILSRFLPLSVHLRNSLSQVVLALWLSRAHSPPPQRRHVTRLQHSRAARAWGRLLASVLGLFITFSYTWVLHFYVVKRLVLCAFWFWLCLGLSYSKTMKVMSCVLCRAWMVSFFALKSGFVSWWLMG